MKIMHEIAVIFIDIMSTKNNTSFKPQNIGSFLHITEFEF